MWSLHFASHLEVPYVIYLYYSLVLYLRDSWSLLRGLALKLNVYFQWTLNFILLPRLFYFPL